ncbi:MAG TPA: hypothetical protein VFV58_14505 [Blastocatellia bacterium]|jgi:hypothetical protein|nr:hypothetical protein [Blastocatellia bacterium]
MNIGKLISTFVVGCLFALSLTMGANVKAQTGSPQLMRTSGAQENSQNMGKKKHGKHKHKKASHHHGQ